MVMGVRRQIAIRKFDAPAIEQRAACSESDEHRSVRLLGNADSRRSLCSFFRHGM
jgi:hypothetical protein